VIPGKTTLATILPNDPSLLDARALAEAEARLRAAQAGVLQAEATQLRMKEAYDLAKHNYDRAKALLETQAMAKEGFDQAEHLERMAAEELRASQFSVKVAQFELEQAKAALSRSQTSQSAQQKLESFVIRSPIAGRLLRVFQESAGPVTPGTKLMEVGDPTDLEIEIDVLSSDAAKIKPGARVMLEHWGGPEALQGRVRLVEPSGFLKLSALGVEEQRVYVIVDFLEPPMKRITLGDAFRVDARIVIWEGDNVLKVPTGALFRTQGEWAVFQIVNNRATLTKVKLGKQNGLEAEVLEGLRADESVVLHPSDRIKEGIKLKARD
jgi:HlyD family secretion protein